MGEAKEEGRGEKREEEGAENGDVPRGESSPIMITDGDRQTSRDRQTVARAVAVAVVVIVFVVIVVVMNAVVVVVSATYRINTFCKLIYYWNACLYSSLKSYVCYLCHFCYVSVIYFCSRFILHTVIRD